MRELSNYCRHINFSLLFDSCVIFIAIVLGYDPSICHHLSLSESICQGYLTKEGGTYDFNRLIK